MGKEKKNRKQVLLRNSESFIEINYLFPPEYWHVVYNVYILVAYFHDQNYFVFYVYMNISYSFIP